MLRVTPSAIGEFAERAAAAHEVDEFVRATLPPASVGAALADILLRPGEPADAILHAAAELSAGLIVIGTHGRGALARAFLGSTATAILRDAYVPVLVVPVRGRNPVVIERGTPVFRTGTILVPLDLQTDAASQMLWTARLRPAAAHPPVLLHVVPPGHARGTEIDRVRAAAAGAPGVAPVRAIVREGRVVPEVIAAVEQEHAGLVIMGRSSDAPGTMAYDVLLRTDALILMAP